MKTLKLTGLTRYIAPFTKFIAVQKDEVIAVDDAVAEHLLKGFEASRDRGTFPHFEEVSGVPANHDFTTAAAANVAKAKVEAIEVAKAEVAAIPPTEAELELAARIAAAEADPVTATDAAALPDESPVEPAPAAKKTSQRVARKSK